MGRQYLPENSFCCRYFNMSVVTFNCWSAVRTPQLKKFWNCNENVIYCVLSHVFTPKLVCEERIFIAWFTNFSTASMENSKNLDFLSKIGNLPPPESPGHVRRLVNSEAERPSNSQFKGPKRLGVVFLANSFSLTLRSTRAFNFSLIFFVWQFCWYLHTPISSGIRTRKACWESPIGGPSI